MLCWSPKSSAFGVLVQSNGCESRWRIEGIVWVLLVHGLCGHLHVMESGSQGSVAAPSGFGVEMMLSPSPALSPQSSGWHNFQISELQHHVELSAGSSCPVSPGSHPAAVLCHQPVTQQLCMGQASKAALYLRPGIFGCCPVPPETGAVQEGEVGLYLPRVLCWNFFFLSHFRQKANLSI